MPEGDTIFRAARTLREVLEGRTVTDVATRVTQIRRLGPARLVGQQIAEVEPRGKHLLLWFAPSSMALHTHMRMTGSWHVYRTGDQWRRPARLATIRLDVAGWTAVAFSVPVCELLSAEQVLRHPSLAALGPDALAPGADLGVALARLEERGSWTIGEALLDQRVLAGVGNVYKCEVLFLHGVHPWTAVADVPPEVRVALLGTAQRLLRLNVGHGAPMRVTTGAPAGSARGDALWVYGRARRSCRRCGTPVAVRRQGAQARITYWCPGCQPGPASGYGTDAGPDDGGTDAVG